MDVVPQKLPDGSIVNVSRSVFSCAFNPGEEMELELWLSDSKNHSRENETREPFFKHSGVRYVYTMPTLEVELTVPRTDDIIKGNASVYLHAYLSTTSSNRRSAEIHYQLNRYSLPPPPEGFKSLLESTAEQRDQVARLRREHDSLPWISYWKNNVTLTVVTDLGNLTKQLPESIQKLVTFNNITGEYAPVFYVNDFWTYKDHFYPINDTLTTLPLQVIFKTQGPLWWQLQTQMEASFEMQKQWGSMGDEMDDMKRVLSDTNPWLLALTMVVSITHMVFDFLAFKNDISFWKSRKSLEGLSVRSILISFGCQLIIFLYLADSETSWMILLSAGISVLIEGWKITKTNDVTLSRQFPFIRLKDKNSYSNKTREFDEQAMQYLGYVVYPLMVAYAIYSLIYNQHKSYYSWLIGSASGAVYMFGFLQMTPQLFINYKLKSVAHLPWRVFVYKALNTFIDDMFAFIIKMPTLHRLSVFRDDIIFFIFLYQRWIYRTDKTRVNEFGQSFEEETASSNNAVAAPTAQKKKAD